MTGRRQSLGEFRRKREDEGERTGEGEGSKGLGESLQGFARWQAEGQKPKSSSGDFTRGVKDKSDGGEFESAREAMEGGK